MVAGKHENGEEQCYGYDGEKQPANGAYGERKPETLFCGACNKGYESKYGRQYGEHDRSGFKSDWLHEQSVLRFGRIAGAAVVVLVDDVYGCVDSYAAQQYERGESTLVKLQFKEIESKECSDERYGYYGYDNQWLA